jgi:NADH-quinone oxidoreductase subunit H
MAELGVIGLRVLSLLGLLVIAAALLTWLERRFLCGEGGDG